MALSLVADEKFPLKIQFKNGGGAKIFFALDLKTVLLRFNNDKLNGGSLVAASLTPVVKSAFKYDTEMVEVPKYFFQYK
jgi:hypothetical protein